MHYDPYRKSTKHRPNVKAQLENLARRLKKRLAKKRKAA
jgi:hypothetical protein